MNNLVRNNRIVKRIAAACVVAAGIVIVWLVVTMWLGSLAATLLPHSDGRYETLQVAFDGTPVISTYESGGDTGSLITARRTLDGQPRPLEFDEWLIGPYLPAPYEPPGIVELPLSWDEGQGRTAGETDGKLTPTAWYLVRDNDRTGGVYLAGYDGYSKKCVGYIGRDGFRASKPLASEQFLVPKTNPQEGFRYVAGGRNLDFRQLVRNYQMFDDDPASWTITVLETDRIWDIDLRQRTVRPRVRLEHATSFGEMRVSQTTFDKVPVVDSKFGPLTEADKEQAKKDKERQTKNEEGPVKFAGLSLVREWDRLVVIEPKSRKWKEFTLPEQLRDRRFSAFLVGPDEMLIYAFEQFGEYWSGGPITRIFWINSQGQIRREQELRLTGWVPSSPEAIAWRSCIYAPIPVAWVVGFIAAGPLYMLQTNFFHDYASALGFVANNAWVPLIVVLVLGIVCTWFTLRLQRKHRRSESAVWAVFVFFFGVPGLLAYSIEHRRAKLEDCPQCGEVVPRDRNTCAACNAEFAPPPRVGTEIFA